MTDLYLIRHAGCIYAEREGRKRDLGLSPQGKEQAERFRDRLLNSKDINPDIFIASTERGAQETAQIIASAFEQPMISDSDVEEWRSEDGSFSSEEFMRCWQELPETQKPFYRWIAGYENWVEFSARVQNASTRFAQHKEHINYPLSTAGSIKQVGIGTLQRLSPPLTNCCPTPPCNRRPLSGRFCYLVAC